MFHRFAGIRLFVSAEVQLLPANSWLLSSRFQAPETVSMFRPLPYLIEVFNTN
jgi:hypothetical protein